MHILAGIDIGTTRSKLYLYDKSLSLLKGYSQPSPLKVKGYKASHDPWRLREILHGLIKKAINEGAKAVGIAVYRASVAAWSEEGEPLTDVILWLDRERRHNAAAEIRGLAVLARHLPIYSSILAQQSPLPLISRLQQENPGARSWTIDALIAEWVGLGYVSDYTNAALTGLINPSSLKEIPLAARLAGLPKGFKKPRLVPNALPEAEGPVRALIADQQSALVGLGCLRGGCTKLSLGTGGFADSPGVKIGVPRKGLLPIVMAGLDGLVYRGVESLVPGLGLALEWASSVLGGYKFFTSLTPEDCKEWSGSLLLPYPAGPGAGYGGYHMSLIGGILPRTKSSLACSVLAGVTLAALDILGLHKPQRKIYLVGGIARIPLVRELILLGSSDSMEYCSEDPTPRGAAALAGHALGLIDAKRLDKPSTCMSLGKGKGLGGELVKEYKLVVKSPGDPDVWLRLKSIRESILSGLTQR